MSSQDIIYTCAKDTFEDKKKREHPSVRRSGLRLRHLEYWTSDAGLTNAIRYYRFIHVYIRERVE